MLCCPCDDANLACVIRRLLLAAASVLAALLIASCSAGGSTTDCGLDGCAITFPRSGDSTVSVLGIQVRLVGVEGGVATVEAAGNRAQLPVGAQTDAGGFTVGVERVTDTEVVVRVRPA